MQDPVKDRVVKLREEIAEISEANRLYLQGGKTIPGADDQLRRRIQRLQDILDELMALTDWKKV
jgi:hypothetical protein